MSKDSGRMHFRNRRGIEMALTNRGVEEDQIFSLLTLAETYGNVHIPMFEVLDDSWGKHVSLTIQKNSKVDSWDLLFQTHLDY